MLIKIFVFLWPDATRIEIRIKSRLIAIYDLNSVFGMLQEHFKWYHPESLDLMVIYGLSEKMLSGINFWYATSQIFKIFLNDDLRYDLNRAKFNDELDLH